MVFSKESACHLLGGPFRFDFCHLARGGGVILRSALCYLGGFLKSISCMGTVCIFECPPPTTTKELRNYNGCTVRWLITGCHCKVQNNVFHMANLN